MNSKITIGAIAACAVIAVGGYCGFIKYQTSVFDEKAQQFSEYENKTTKFHMETIGSTFTSRTVQITQEIKDLDAVISYIAETNFGWNPTTRIYSFKSGSVELNQLLEKVSSGYAGELYEDPLHRYRFLLIPRRHLTRRKILAIRSER